MGKPVGWRGQPARHSLAKRGVKTCSNSPYVVPTAFTKRTKKAYREVSKHNLNINEWGELRDLINLIDVVECFGTRDVLRREQLERKATEEELRAAWSDAGMPAEQFDDAYN